MARYRLVAALAATAIGLVSAQTGYGRFPCAIINGDGSYSPDQSQCADGALMAPGANDPSADNQGDRASPTGAICQLEQESGAYFCGIAGAPCTTDANCDNGVCSNGVCQGGFMQGCAGMDQYCNGFLYCVDASFEPTASNTCGGFGAFCQDHAAVDPSLSVDEAQPVFNQFCSTGYCNSQSGNCDNIAQIGEDCSSDPSFKCGSDAVCDNGVCTPIAVPLPTPYTVYKTIQLTDGPPSGLVNLAPSASLTASSEVHDAPLSAIVDGKIGGKVNGVGSDMENWSTAWEKAGAWAALSWSQPITVHRIVLWDRPNLNDWVTGSRITLSDGRVIGGLTPLDNDGRQGFGLDFLPPVTTSSIRIDITDVGQATYAIGLSEVQVYGPALVVVPSGPVNLALSAVCSASSEWAPSLASSACDGVVGGYVASLGGDKATLESQEWGTRREGGGAWLLVSWSSPVSFNQVVLWDRLNPNDNILAGLVELADGSFVSFGSLDPNGATGTYLNLASTVTTTSIKVYISAVSSSTQNIGLAEVQVYLADLSGVNPNSLLTLTFPPVTPPAPVNLALSAVCSASSEWAPSLASSACDGVVGGYVASLGGDKATLESQEWGTRGEGGGAWLLVSWSSPVSFNQVVLWDRLNPDDNIVAGRVEFGNGLFVGFGALDPNGAAGMYLNLDSTVTTSSIKVYISAVSSSTQNIGLAEVQVYLADLSALDPLSLLSPSYLPSTTTTTSTGTSTAVPTPTGSNIAPLASASASAEGPNTPASYAISGVDGPFPDTDHNKEWGTPGGTRSAWLTLTWPSPVSVDSIVLWDRPNSADQITGGSVEFDDGTSTPFGAVPNSAQEGLLITLSSTKTISSLKVAISSVSDSTYATGLAQLQVFGTVLPLPATTTTTTTTSSSSTIPTSSTAAVPLATTPNLALRAIATASSEWPNSKAAAVRDSVIGGYVTDFVGDETKEWSSYTEGGGAWIRLDWASPVSLNRVVLWDRPNSLDQVLSGNITFSDGSGVDFGAVPNDASSALYVDLTAPVTATSLKVYVFEVSSTTQNAGFAEIQVYKADLSTANPSSLVSPTFPAGFPLPTPSTSTSASASTTTTTSLSMTTSVRSTTSTSADSGPTLAPAPPATANGNIAPLASVGATSEGSSTPAYYAISGATGPFVDGPNNKEWGTAPNTISGWLMLSWPTPVEITSIVLWDRPNPQDQVMGGWVDFEDGSVALIGELDNTASVGFSVPLDSPKVGRTIKINLSSTSASTYAIGLAQVQVFGTVLPLNGDSTTTTTITSSSSSSNANPQVTPAPTPNAGSQTPFRVQGAAATTKVLDAPVMAYCGGSRAYRECKAGADELVQCCTADAATCAVIHEANLQNCDTIGEASYLCASSEDGDMEECCEAMFDAYFAAGEEPARGNGCGAMRR